MKKTKYVVVLAVLLMSNSSRSSDDDLETSMRPKGTATEASPAGVTADLIGRFIETMKEVVQDEFVEQASCKHEQFIKDSAPLYPFNAYNYYRRYINPFSKIDVINKTQYLVHVNSSDMSAIISRDFHGLAMVDKEFSFRVVQPQQIVKEGPLKRARDVVLLARTLKTKSEMRDRKELVIFEKDNELKWCFY